MPASVFAQSDALIESISRRYGRSRKEALKVAGAMAAMRRGYFKPHVVVPTIGPDFSEKVFFGLDWADPVARELLPSGIFPPEMRPEDVSDVLCDMRLWRARVVSREEMDDALFVGIGDHDSSDPWTRARVRHSMVVDEEGMRIYVEAHIHGDSMLYLSRDDQHARMRLLLRLIKAAKGTADPSDTGHLVGRLFAPENRGSVLPVDMALPRLDSSSQVALLERLLLDIEPAPFDELKKYLDADYRVSRVTEGWMTGADRRGSHGAVDRLALLIWPWTSTGIMADFGDWVRGAVFWEYARDRANTWVVSASWDRISDLMDAAELESEQDD